MPPPPADRAREESIRLFAAHSVTRWIGEQRIFLTSLFFPPSFVRASEIDRCEMKRHRSDEAAAADTGRRRGRRRRGGGRSRFFWGRRKLAGRSFVPSLVPSLHCTRHHCSIGVRWAHSQVRPYFPLFFRLSPTLSRAAVIQSSPLNNTGTNDPPPLLDR